MNQFQNALFCTISASCSNINPRDIRLFLRRKFSLSLSLDKIERFEAGSIFRRTKFSQDFTGYTNAASGFPRRMPRHPKHNALEGAAVDVTKT
jgi:hypothetical protein